MRPLLTQSCPQPGKAGWKLLASPWGHCLLSTHWLLLSHWFLRNCPGAIQMSTIQCKTLGVSPVSSVIFFSFGPWQFHGIMECLEWHRLVCIQWDSSESASGNQRTVQQNPASLGWYQGLCDSPSPKLLNVQLSAASCTCDANPSGSCPMLPVTMISHAGRVPGASCH